MTVTVEPQLETRPEADEAEPVDTAPETSGLQLLAALLAEAYAVMPLFA